jgi:hypothetical protein
MAKPDPIKYDYTTNKLTTQARYCVWDSTVNNCVCEVVYHDSSKAKLVYAVTQTPQHSNVSFSNFSNHSDRAHSDIAHSDGTQHDDIAHSDVAFSNFSNHSDKTRGAKHSDTSLHSDMPHSDVAHADGTQHVDVAHSDVAFSNYTDHANVVHSDVGNCPGYDNAASFDSVKFKLVYESLSGVCYVSG